MGSVRAAGWLLALAATPLTSGDPAPEHPDITRFFEAASSDEALARAALEEIEGHWRDGYTPMLIDLARMLRPPARDGAPGAAATRAPLEPFDTMMNPFDARPPAGPALGDPGSPIRRRLLRFLKQRTGQQFGDDGSPDLAGPAEQHDGLGFLEGVLHMAPVSRLGGRG